MSEIETKLILILNRDGHPPTPFRVLRRHDLPSFVVGYCLDRPECHLNVHYSQLSLPVVAKAEEPKKDPPANEPIAPNPS